MPARARMAALLLLFHLCATPAAGVGPRDGTTGLAGEPDLAAPEAALAPTARGAVPVRPAPVAAAHGRGHLEIANTWALLRVGTKGVQEVRGSDLVAAGFDLAAFDPRVFRLYVRPGLPLLREDEIDPEAGLVEVSIRVDGASDGRFDPADRLFFWGVAASGWYDEFGVEGAEPDVWLDHPYESHNAYWLALDPTVAGTPARWTTRDVAPVRPEAAPVDTFRARMHLEENRVYVEGSYEEGLPWDRWADRRLASFQEPVTLEAEVDGIVAGTVARVRARFWGIRNASAPGISHSLSLRLNDAPLALEEWTGATRSDLDTTTLGLVEGTNRLTVTLWPPPPVPGFPSVSDQVALHFWEVHFARRFTARGDTLEYVAPATPVTGAFALAPFATAEPDSIHLLDVSEPLSPVALVGAAPFDTAGARGVRLHDDHPGARIFVAAAPAWQRPVVARATIRDVLHGGADYVVLCVDTLVTAAERLAEHRRLRPPFAGATAAVVRLSDVYAAYSGGRTDPTAIRNFLHDAITGGNWSPAPSCVCLFGDATTDPKDRGGNQAPGTGRLRLPTHDAFFAGEAFENDAWFADIDVAADAAEIGDLPEIAIGRLPVRDLGQAMAVVGKVRNADLRRLDADEAGGNRLLWSVDDASQRGAPDPLGGEFTASVEALDRDHVPGWVERRKVNLLEHPPASDGTKPSGRDSLIAELLRGTVVWFYVGRGNGFKLADENLYVITDASALEDVGRLPFFVATTTGAGGFASPFVTLLAESLVVQWNGGVLAAFASGANTFAFANQVLGRALLDAMFVTPSPEGGPTLGAIALGAARATFANGNTRSYNLLGDPASRLTYPTRDLRLSLFDDVTGEALVDSIPRGRRIRVEGEVLTDRGKTAVVDPTFAGQARVSISDAPPVHFYPSFAGPMPYEGNADIVQEGMTLGMGGRFVSRLVIPVAAQAGPGARVQTVTQGFDVASGATRWILGGVQPDPADTTGPTIELTFDHRGPIHAPNAGYGIRFDDPSGIFLLAPPPEHRVTLAIDDAPPVDITDAVHPNRIGSLIYFGSLPGLADGDHVLRVAASDHLADPGSGAAGVHRSELVVPFRVAGYLGTPAIDARTLPNPFTPERGTMFVLRAGFFGSADIAIHDVRGRRVRSLRSTGIGGLIEVAWDGRDDAGRRLAPGVYPWQATVANSGGESRQFGGRLVLVR